METAIQETFDSNEYSCSDLGSSLKCSTYLKTFISQHFLSHKYLQSDLSDVNRVSDSCEINGGQQDQ